MIWRCRKAPSLGALEGETREVWGIDDYCWPADRHKACVFFGLYDLRDYLALWRHQGPKSILWAGSDLLNLKNGFVFNDGKLRTLSLMTKGQFSNWIRKILSEAEHYVETEAEADTLREYGILRFKVIPSYMGDTTAFKPSYRHSSKPHAYLCSPEGREAEYGWVAVDAIAKQLPRWTFHLYGSNSWTAYNKNVKLRGRVPKEQMNEEIKNMQAALRLNKHDGFSEIVAKGVLMGKHVVTRIPHPLLPHFKHEQELVTILEDIRLHGHKGPHPKVREYYLNRINDYPWNYARFSNRSRRDRHEPLQRTEGSSYDVYPGH